MNSCMLCCKYFAKQQVQQPNTHEFLCRRGIDYIRVGATFICLNTLEKNAKWDLHAAGLMSFCKISREVFNSFRFMALKKNRICMPIIFKSIVMWGAMVKKSVKIILNISRIFYPKANVCLLC